MLLLFCWHPTYACRLTKATVKVVWNDMKNRKRIIIVTALIFGIGALVQTSYAANCFQSGASDPCMASHSEAPGSDSSHRNCSCNPNDNFSSSAGCHFNAVYPRLEMAVIRLDLNHVQPVSNDFYIKHSASGDEVVPIRISVMSALSPPTLKLPIFMRTPILVI